jgi:ribosomal protein S12 methylthiotransferase
MIPVGVITLGCPKNTTDTEALLAEIPSRYSLANVEDADIVFLNTCAFLKTARDETSEQINRLAEKKVILLGCIIPTITLDIFEKFPQIHGAVSTANYTDIGAILDRVLEGEKVWAVGHEPPSFVELRGKVSITPQSYSYIKIAEGCNNRCSFCLIPSIKGPYRSRRFEHIVNEAYNLVGSGTKELVLVAQDTGYYGMDLYGKLRLPELLEAIAGIEGDFWVRVMYTYPERITDELLQTMARHPKIVPYLDIPLQHGDPEILRAMRRPYEVHKLLKKIDHIREVLPTITLRTSLIVGFPGETDEHFERLADFVQGIQFDHVGVFEYSREKGTPAFDLPNQVLDAVKAERRERLMILQQDISQKKHAAKIGQTVKVLVDFKDPSTGRWVGRTQHFAPEVDGSVFLTGDLSGGISGGQFIKCIIEQADPYDLYAKPIS